MKVRLKNPYRNGPLPVILWAWPRSISEASMGKSKPSVRFRWAKHSEMDHCFADGRQLNWTSVSGAVNSTAFFFDVLDLLE